MLSNIEFDILQTPRTISGANNNAFSRRTSNFFPSPTNIESHNHQLLSPPSSQPNGELFHQLGLATIPQGSLDRMFVNTFDLENSPFVDQPIPHFKHRVSSAPSTTATHPLSLPPPPPQPVQQHHNQMMGWKSTSNLTSPILDNIAKLKDMQATHSLNFSLNDDMSRLSLQPLEVTANGSNGIQPLLSTSINFDQNILSSSSIWSEVKTGIPPVLTLKLGNSLFEDTDDVFLPFFGEEEKTTPLPNIDPNEKEGKREKENIYLTKVNNPAFIPTCFNESTIPKVQTAKALPKVMVKTVLENKKIRKRSEQRNSEGSPDARSSKQNSQYDTKKGQLNKNPKYLNDKKRLLPTTRRYSYSKLEKTENISSFTKENVKLNLGNPRIPNLTSNDYFNRDILQAPEAVANRYLEDYCSTFYKRNIHGYMFTREPSNSLKVSTTGNKSWVQLKIKLGNQEGNNQKLPLSRKLKVDVRELPVWKPINLNSGTGHHPSNGGASQSRKLGNGSNRKKWGKEFSKGKPSSIPKRFRKRAISEQ